MTTSSPPPPPPPPVIRRRRSLTNVGGDVETSGDREKADILAHALDVAAPRMRGASSAKFPDETIDQRRAASGDTAEDEDRVHVHGFHAYPARAHPVTVRRLIDDLVPRDGTVLDPFCGSGTILVEAMLAGRATVGVDLNPIAVMLARAKTFPRSAEKTTALVDAANAVAEFASERRLAKAGATRRLPQEDVSIFAPHVILELDGIRAGIEKAPPESRPELGLVLSSILVKLSQQRGDTTNEAVAKRIAAGYPSRLFVKKTEELARRFTEFAELLETPWPKARVYEDDANVLKKVQDASIDAVITSPPYVATYDYLTHHELRMRWLGLDSRKLAKSEMGARRHYEDLNPRAAVAAWEEELAKLFVSLARVTKHGAPIVLLIADSAVGQGRKRGAKAEPVRADEVVARVAERIQTIVPVARASQARPHFHGPTSGAFVDRPRLEHALLLERS